MPKRKNKKKADTAMFPDPQKAIQSAISNRLTKSVSSKPSKLSSNGGSNASASSRKRRGQNDDDKNRNLTRVQAQYSIGSAGDFKRKVVPVKGKPGGRVSGGWGRENSGTVSGRGGIGRGPKRNKGTGATPFSNSSGSRGAARGNVGSNVTAKPGAGPRPNKQSPRR